MWGGYTRRGMIPTIPRACRLRRAPGPKQGSLRAAFGPRRPTLASGPRRHSPLPPPPRSLGARSDGPRARRRGPGRAGRKPAGPAVRGAAAAGIGLRAGAPGMRVRWGQGRPCEHPRAGMRMRGARDGWCVLEGGPHPPGRMPAFLENYKGGSVCGGGWGDSVGDPCLGGQRHGHGQDQQVAVRDRHVQPRLLRRRRPMPRPAAAAAAVAAPSESADCRDSTPFGPLRYVTGVRGNSSAACTPF